MIHIVRSILGAASCLAVLSGTLVQAFPGEDPWVPDGQQVRSTLNPSVVPTFNAGAAAAGEFSGDGIPDVIQLMDNEMWVVSGPSMFVHAIPVVANGQTSVTDVASLESGVPGTPDWILAGEGSTLAGWQFNGAEEVRDFERTDFYAFGGEEVLLLEFGEMGPNPGDELIVVTSSNVRVFNVYNNGATPSFEPIHTFAYTGMIHEIRAIRWTSGSSLFELALRRSSTLDIVNTLGDTLETISTPGKWVAMDVVNYGTSVERLLVVEQHAAPEDAYQTTSVRGANGLVESSYFLAIMEVQDVLCIDIDGDGREDAVWNARFDNNWFACANLGDGDDTGVESFPLYEIGVPFAVVDYGTSQANLSSELVGHDLDGDGDLDVYGMIEDVDGFIFQPLLRVLESETKVTPDPVLAISPPTTAGMDTWPAYGFPSVHPDGATHFVITVVKRAYRTNDFSYVHTYEFPLGTILPGASAWVVPQPVVLPESTLYFASSYDFVAGYKELDAEGRVLHAWPTVASGLESPCTIIQGCPEGNFTVVPRAPIQGNQTNCVPPPGQFPTAP